MTAQHVEAHGAALRIRIQRATLRREIIELGRKQGNALLADAIEELPDWLARADALTAIGWGFRVGDDKADEIYGRSGARFRKRLCELTPRQRHVIGDALREFSVGRSHGSKAAA
jgi:hypothetical protein